jgi:predicted AlkP superfamily pyrophosphatase or phosphodiesterase
MLTGVSPDRHGVIANGFFYRDRNEIEFWVAHNDIIGQAQTWDYLKRADRSITSAAWHTQNIKGAGADFIVTPSPIHDDDGSTRLWCYSQPEGTYQALVDKLGHFPLQHYWGPLANIESTRWILNGARWLINNHQPNFHWIYIPQLDYAAQKFGPDSVQAGEALVELDAELAAFQQFLESSPIAEDAVVLVAGEYALTEVGGVVFPNRILRETDMLSVRQTGEGEFLDLESSRAVAMVDHQLAHVFVRESSDVPRCVEAFRDVPGVDYVLAGEQRAELGMTHERAGDIVLVTRDDHWLAYYWWLDNSHAPPFARTVDIHAKPGYDPVEMFVDPETRSISLDASLVRGSHGVPATHDRHKTALICSKGAPQVEAGHHYRDTQINGICLSLMGVETGSA